MDVFRGALGSIVRKPTRAIIGKAGPEAVLPLSGNTTSFSATAINITVNANADPREIAAAVERVTSGIGARRWFRDLFSKSVIEKSTGNL